MWVTNKEVRKSLSSFTIEQRQNMSNLSGKLTTTADLVVEITFRIQEIEILQSLIDGLVTRVDQIQVKVTELDENKDRVHKIETKDSLILK